MDESRSARGPLALALDRGAQETRTVKAIAEGGAVSSLPGVGAGIQVAIAVGDVGDSPNDDPPILIQPTTRDPMDLLPPMIQVPEGCGSFPCEQ